MADPKPPLFLGIDCGTQSLRSGIFDLAGKPVVAAVREYPTDFPRVAWAEQQPHDWWNAVKETVAECLDRGRVRPADIAGISLDGTACTVVVAKDNGEPLRPGILWMDVRAHDQAERVTATGDPVLKYVGEKESPEWMIPKALWLKENEPRVYEKAERIAEVTDWLMFRLTGRWTASLNVATCKWNYATPEGGWPRRLLETLGLPEILDKWPQDVLALGERAGELTKTVAADLGLPAGIPVAEGGIDAYTGMLGMATVKPGRMAVVMGSSTCHMGLSDRGIFGSGVWGPYPDALIRGTWVLEGGQTATGSIVKWFRDSFAAGASYAALDEKAAAIPPGAEGLVLVDYFQGNRTPIRDPLVRGALWGLGLKHTPAHVFRAILEGTAYGTRHILEDLTAHGFKAAELYATGGGAKSRLWLQITADVCGLPIFLSEVGEATTLGSAIAAAVGAGYYPDLAQASANMVTITGEVKPDPARRDDYDFYFRQYVETYPALAPLMHEVSRRVQSG
ncbi:MAG TPA: FGGY-family carbohydrate kinase [Armatimonadota bacterium]|nr:FGGY-family carbohydrate kinase [Armatimonadota bacterium]